MKLAAGIWFPDDENHLTEMVASSTKIDGKGTYQYHKLTAALNLVKQRRCAIDVGMHVGLWAMHLAKLFKSVIGFEPVSKHIECLRLNMQGFDNYDVYNCALGDRTASVGLKLMPGSTGSTQIAHVDGHIPMLPLDQFAFEAVDFIKIDVEGYEYFVVKGGERTIRTHKPVIILEQKLDNTGRTGEGVKLDYGLDKYAANNLLKSWGARHRFEMNGDFCFTW